MTRPQAPSETEDNPWGADMWFRLMAVAIIMGFFLSFVGALGTHEAPFLPRLGYWVLLMIAGSLVATGINYVLRVKLIPKAPLLLQEVAGVIFATIGITFTVWLISPLYWGSHWNTNVIRFLIPIVFVITLLMTFLHYLIDRKPRQSHGFTPRPAPAQMPASGATVPDDTKQIAFYARLPAKFGLADIRALSAEDHYLRVHTDRGEALILMRLYDAIRELEGIEGSQVHRSWWVARSSIIEVCRRDGRFQLRLEGGLSVPVSRGFQKALKQDGWL